MKKITKSYKILHDFLYDVDENDIILQTHTFDENIAVIKLSDIMKCTTYESLCNLIGKFDSFIINDDINELKNPESIKFKEFLISCVAKKYNKITIYKQ